MIDFWISEILGFLKCPSVFEFFVANALILSTLALLASLSFSSVFAIPCILFSDSFVLIFLFLLPFNPSSVRTLFNVVDLYNDLKSSPIFAFCNCSHENSFARSDFVCKEFLLIKNALAEIRLHKLDVFDVRRSVLLH